MRDQIVLQFTGGVGDPSNAIVGLDQTDGVAPGIIKGNLPGGVYVKVGESIKPSRIPDGDPIRVASYEWRREGKVA